MERQFSAEVDAVDETSAAFLGQWQRLVSTTNWEKGRIICQWREALAQQGAPPAEFSDEAWGRRVGSVTSQHVGRLRRVYERFGDAHLNYRSLYWSHFLAALDWDDAEMWLEGAVQNEWSISQMRQQRWETLGALAEERPSDDEIIVAETDEDAAPLTQDDHADAPFDDDAHEAAAGPDSMVAADGFPETSPDDTAEDDAVAAPVRPFAALGELPDDLAEAFESYKLAILRHKLAGWQQVSRDDVLASLDALKQLALLPTEA
jgi:hypothetical protein